MCYNAVSATKKMIVYAKHRQEDLSKVEELEQKLRELAKHIRPHYFISGFAHPKLIGFTKEEPLKPIAMQWGLIPNWAKDASIAKHTLNARIETILEKPAFKNAITKQRCLIYLDGYFEYHHQDKKTFPFLIQAKTPETPLVLAGIYENWHNPLTDETIISTSIVTTKANGIMAKIHNNPKMDEARIPVILNKVMQNEYLKQDAPIKDLLQQLAIPFPEQELKYHTVGKLTGKDSLGDVPEVLNAMNYEELKTF
jgi:putative SOS response-associated peptidase YedK